MFARIKAIYTATITGVSAEGKPLWTSFWYFRNFMIFSLPWSACLDICADHRPDMLWSPLHTSTTHSCMQEWFLYIIAPVQVIWLPEDVRRFCSISVSIDAYMYHNTQSLSSFFAQDTYRKQRWGRYPQASAHARVYSRCKWAIEWSIFEIVSYISIACRARCGFVACCQGWRVLWVYAVPILTLIGTLSIHSYNVPHRHFSLIVLLSRTIQYTKLSGTLPASLGSIKGLQYL